MRGAEPGREDLLGLRSPDAAVAAADLAHDDRGAKRVFGAPVGRVDRGVPEEGEEGRRFDHQMGGESLYGWDRRPRGGEQVERLREQPTSAQEMRTTRLMIGMPEAAVRRPPIAREYARQILAEDGGRIHKSAAGPNGVDRGVDRGERPEPVQRAGHFPPGLVGTHDRTAAAQPAAPRQENNRSAWARCKMNMILHGLSDARIEFGDTTLSPKLVDEGGLLLYDRVIANPPLLVGSVADGVVA